MTTSPRDKALEILNNTSYPEDMAWYVETIRAALQQMAEPVEVVTVETLSEDLAGAFFSTSTDSPCKEVALFLQSRYPAGMRITREKE